MSKGIAAGKWEQPSLDEGQGMCGMMVQTEGETGGCEVFAIGPLLLDLRQVTSPLHASVSSSGKWG